MMKKIPFDISYREKIESGEVSVVTRDDHPVRIICWDTSMEWSICALIKDHDPKSTYGFPQLFDKEGKCIREESKDLFLLVECELTEFEALVEGLMTGIRNGLTFSFEDEVSLLLEAARKALRPEFDEELEQAYKNQDDVVYRRGYEEGFQAGSAIDEERLTDKIAEKIAEKVVKGGNPFVTYPVIVPDIPKPWTPGSPVTPETVMYGCTPTEFRPTAANPAPATASAATSIKVDEEE